MSSEFNFLFSEVQGALQDSVQILARLCVLRTAIGNAGQGLRDAMTAASSTLCTLDERLAVLTAQTQALCEIGARLPAEITSVVHSADSAESSWQPLITHCAEALDFLTAQAARIEELEQLSAIGRDEPVRLRVLALNIAMLMAASNNERKNVILVISEETEELSQRLGHTSASMSVLFRGQRQLNGIARELVQRLQQVVQATTREADSRAMVPREVLPALVAATQHVREQGTILSSVHASQRHFEVSLAALDHTARTAAAHSTPIEDLLQGILQKLEAAQRRTQVAALVLDGRQRHDFLVSLLTAIGKTPAPAVSSSSPDEGVRTALAGLAELRSELSLSTAKLSEHLETESSEVLSLMAQAQSMQEPAQRTATDCAQLLDLGLSNAQSFGAARLMAGPVPNSEHSNGDRWQLIKATAEGLRSQVTSYARLQCDSDEVLRVIEDIFGLLDLLALNIGLQGPYCDAMDVAYDVMKQIVDRGMSTMSELRTLMPNAAIPTDGALASLADAIAAACGEGDAHAGNLRKPATDPETLTQLAERSREVVRELAAHSRNSAELQRLGGTLLASTQQLSLFAREQLLLADRLSAAVGRVEHCIQRILCQNERQE